MPEESNHEFTEFFLTEDDLFNLQFTNLPTNPEDNFGTNRFYRGLATRPLWYVVQELRTEILRKDYSRHIEAADVEKFQRSRSIRKRYNQEETELGRIFQALESSPTPWFKRLASIGDDFERERIDSGENLILIRNLSITPIGGELQQGTVEKDESQGCLYHIVDGNHRLLVYALFISFDLMEYDPVKVIHATSWQHSDHKVFRNNAGEKWYDWSSYGLEGSGMIHNPCRMERRLITDEEKRQLFFEKIKLAEKHRKNSGYFMSDRRDSTQNGYAMHNDSASTVDKWPF